MSYLCPVTTIACSPRGHSAIGTSEKSVAIAADTSCPEKIALGLATAAGGPYGAGRGDGVHPKTWTRRAWASSIWAERSIQPHPESVIYPNVPPCGGANGGKFER